METEILTDCPLCAHHTFHPHLTVEDHTVSHGTFQIVRCAKCNLLFTNPRPTARSIGAFYESSKYISHHDTPDSLFNKAYNYIRNIAIRQKVGMLEKYNTQPQPHLLDIGCGTGAFLSACKQAGWNIHGIEPDQDARDIAIRKTGTDIQADIRDINIPQLFSSITLWHVLEHIHSLNDTMQWIEKHLDPKGTLFIAVPNPESFDASKYRKFWAAYDVPRHLYHFTKSTMEKLLLKHHFQLVEIKNMLFDAYYVSLLSNKYKRGQSNLLESFLTGTISNLKGCSANNKTINTSSLIYIARKK